MPAVPPSFKNGKDVSLRNISITELSSSSQHLEQSLEKLAEEISIQEKTLSKDRSTVLTANKFILYITLLFTIVIIAWIGLSEKMETADAQNFVYLKGACPDFVGRTKYLDLLYKDLIGTSKQKNFHNQLKIKVLWGKGGFGKSELAIEFANRFRSHFSLLWTFYCDTQEHIDQGYRDLASNLGLLSAKETPEKTREKVHLYLENHSFNRPWLLIFDNMEKEFTDYPQRGGSILVTSQKKILNPEFLLEIQPLSQEESLELLEKITEEKRGVAMERLAYDLEGIPLLINYTAHYIKATPGCDITEYQHLYAPHLLTKEGPLWSTSDVNHRYLKSLATSWQFPLKSLEKENPQALQWLFVCSYLYPEHIYEEWIDDWLIQTNGGKEKNLQVERKEILKSLQNYGIIRYEEKTETFSLHRFFQLMIRESRKEQFEEDLSQAVSLLEKHSKDYDFYETASWKRGEHWYLHSYEVKTWIQKHPTFLSGDAIKFKTAHLLHQFGEWCLFNYRYAESLDANYEALKLNQSTTSENPLLSSKIYDSIGWNLYELGQYPEALLAYNKADALQQPLFNKDLLHYAEILNDKGIVLYALGEYVKALNCHEQALTIRLKYRGDSHPEIAGSLHNMAQCLNKMGDHQKAIELYENAGEIDLKTFTKNHPYLLSTLIWKAIAIGDQGNYSKALKLLKQALADYFSAQGQKHGELATAWNGMGTCYLHLQNSKEARRMFKKALKQQLSYLGEHSPPIVISYNGICWSYLKERKLKQSIHYLSKHLETSLILYEHAPKKMSEILEDFQKTLRLILAEGATTEQIDAMVALAYKMSEGTLGKNHPITLSLQKEFFSQPINAFSLK